MGGPGATLCHPYPSTCSCSWHSLLQTGRDSSAGPVTTGSCPELTLSQLEVGMPGWAGEQALVLSPRQLCAAAAQLSLGIRCAFNIPSPIKAARQLPENYQWGLVHISVPGVTISSHICTKQHFGGSVTGRILAHLRESPSLTGANSMDILGEDGWG